jgi:hypothetical protein
VISDRFGPLQRQPLGGRLTEDEVQPGSGREGAADDHGLGGGRRRGPDQLREGGLRQAG